MRPADVHRERDVATPAAQTKCALPPLLRRGGIRAQRAGTIHLLPGQRPHRRLRHTGGVQRLPLRRVLLAALALVLAVHKRSRQSRDVQR